MHRPGDGIDSTGHTTHNGRPGQNIMWQWKLPVLEGDRGLATDARAVFLLPGRVVLLTSFQLYLTNGGVDGPSTFRRGAPRRRLDCRVIPDRAYRYRRHAAAMTELNSRSSVRARKSDVIREVVTVGQSSLVTHRARRPSAASLSVVVVPGP